MYVKHSQLNLSYSDSDKIWRYMDFTKFSSLINEGSLFFCRADKLGDKWEGVFPIKMIQRFELENRRIPSNDGNTYTHCQWQITKEAPSHLINCWHANESESFAMWKIYSGDNQQSIAIQSTMGRLKGSLDANTERIWIGEVEYIDFREWEPENRFFNVGTPNILKAFFLKWHYFKYENEIRAVINKPYDKHRSEIGVFVQIDLDELIERIYLSPNSDQENQKQVRDLLNEHNYSFRIEQSDLGMPLYMSMR
jgi:hypothetical protein